MGDVEQRPITDVPLPGATAPKPPTFWVEDDADHALSYADAQTYLDIGITPIEIVRLRWPDIGDDEANYLLWEKTLYPLMDGIITIADMVAEIPEHERALDAAAANDLRLALAVMTAERDEVRDDLNEQEAVIGQVLGLIERNNGVLKIADVNRIHDLLNGRQPDGPPTYPNPDRPHVFRGRPVGPSCEECGLAERHPRHITPGAQPA